MDEALDTSSTAVFDSDGFLLDPAMWSEGLAERVAQNDGFGALNDVQRQVLLALRREYLKHGTVPSLHHVCHLAGQAPDCLHHLFPSPREAWRLAGLPNPGEEAKSYL